MKSKVNRLVQGMDREHADLEIIRISDGKINTHNRIVIAEAFGIFSLLSLSRGKGYLLIQGWSAIVPLFLTVTYLALVGLIFYSFSRSIHYSKVISLALSDISRISHSNGIPQADTIAMMLGDLYDRAQQSIPYSTGEIVRIRRRTDNFVYHLGVYALIFSVMLWGFVLFMP